jgi:endonuclease/exonuclease/phosphatase family metal-dependent hydrolase
MQRPEELLRIVSYNVRYFGHPLKGLASTGVSARGIAARIAALDPVADIVCLQEVESRSLRTRVCCPRAWRGETQLEMFLAELRDAFALRGATSPYVGLYFRADATRIRTLSVATTGLALLVNVRKLSIQAHNAEAPWQVTYRGAQGRWDRMQTRICAYARLAGRCGRSLHVFNTHLSLPAPHARTLFWRLPERLGRAANQVHEARTLASLVRRHAAREPFVLCGDFNAPPGSPVFYHLSREAGFRSAHEDLGLLDRARPAARATFEVMGVRLHLDHAFCGGDAAWVDLHETPRIGDASNDFAGMSDHVPLIGRLRMPARP